MKWRCAAPILVLLLLACRTGAAQEGSPSQPAARNQSRASTDVRREIVFDRRHGTELSLDFYAARPDRDKVGDSGSRLPPLVVWVHGGAWRRGSKSSVPIEPLVRQGFAIASVDYRLSGTAKFPAQVLDIKRAIEFLHERSARLGFDPNRIAIAGASAGGHLAALVGVSNGVDDLQPAGIKPIRLSGIVSFYGASNLQSILGQTENLEKRAFRNDALRRLLGETPDKLPPLAKLASPVAHVTQDDPPILMIHGDADIQMPIAQSAELDATYRKAGLQSRLITVEGGGHGGDAFYTPEMLERVDDWLTKVGVASGVAE